MGSASPRPLQTLTISWENANLTQDQRLGQLHPTPSLDIKVEVPSPQTNLGSDYPIPSCHLVSLHSANNQATL